jgi:hypothetical protein
MWRFRFERVTFSKARVDRYHLHLALMKKLADFVIVCMKTGFGFPYHLWQERGWMVRLVSHSLCICGVAAVS